MSDLVVQMLVRAETAGAVTAIRNAQGAITGLRVDTEKLGAAGLPAMVQVQRGAEGLAEAARSGALSIDALRASVDPAFAASQRYAEIQRAVAALVESGAADQRQANIVLEQAASRYNGVATAAERKAQAERDAALATALATQNYQALRAAVDPVWAASQRYEAALATLDAAQKAGVITDQERARTLALVEGQMIDVSAASAAGVRPMVADLRLLGDTSGATGANLTNLTFQIQDVAMMAAMGQSPIATMLQQGPQIVGVFDQMRQSGQRVGPAILGALTSLISPMSLLTLGVVAGGAALIQWGAAALGAGEDAADLGEEVEGLTELVKAYQTAVEQTAAGNLSLLPDYGSAVGQARELLELQRQMAQVAAERAAADTSMMLGELLGADLVEAATNTRVFGGAETERVEARRAMADILGITGDDEAIAAPILRVAAALDALSAAQGPADQARAMADLRRILLDVTGGVTAMKAEVYDLYKQLLDAEGATLRLAQATKTPAREPDFARQADLAANQERVALISEVLALEREAAAVATERAATDTAAAEAMLADLGDQVALQSLIAQFGEDSAAVARLRAQQEREAFVELLNSSTAAQDLKDRLLAAYDANARLAAVNSASGIGAGANEAARLAANLQAAAAALSGIASAAISAGISNVGQAARLRALQAGESIGDAAVTARIAEERARLIPAMRVGDFNDRRAASGALATLEAELREGVALNEQITAFEAALRDTGGGATGGGGGGAAAISDLERLRDQAAGILEDLALVGEQVGVKVDAGLMTAAEGVDEVGRATEGAANQLADLIPQINRLGPEGAASAAEFTAALETLVGQIGATGSELSQSLSGAFQSSFADFLAGTKSGKDAFADFAASIRREIANIMAERFTTRFVTPLVDSLFGSLFPSAAGNVIAAGAIVPFAKGGMPGLAAHENSIVTSPTLFPMQGGLGLMGEEDPEAILPLKSGPGGFGVLALSPEGPTRLGLARGPGGELGVVLPAIADGGGPARAAVSAEAIRPFAKGGMPGIAAHENSIVTGPTLFPMQGGLGLMGEEDPEAILPLKSGPGGFGVLALSPEGPMRLGLARGPGGELGVVMPDVRDLADRVYARGGVAGAGGSGGGSAGSGTGGSGPGWSDALLGAIQELKSVPPSITLNVTNTAGDVAQADGAVRMEGGEAVVEVLVEKVAARLGQDLRRGGPFARNLEGTYGLGRRGS